MGQYYQVLQQQPDYVHQFYSESSTMLRIDGNTRDTASGMLVFFCISLFKFFLKFTPFLIKTKKLSDLCVSKLNWVNVALVMCILSKLLNGFVGFLFCFS